MIETIDTNKEVNFYLNSFLKEYSRAIYSFGVNAYKTTSTVALAAYKEQISYNLRDACASFLENKSNDITDINKYLYGSLKNATKNITNQGKKTALICPGCRHFNTIEFVIETSNGLSCEACHHATYTNQDEKLKEFYQVFADYSKQGYRCQECYKFIPSNICKDKEVKCPYPNCGHINTIEEKNKISNPLIKISNSAPTNRTVTTINKNLLHEEAHNFMIEIEINNYIKVIKTCIDEQVRALEYKCLPSTYMIKLSMYEAFKKYLDSNPDEMVPYLANIGRTLRNNKIQSKIFQEFIRELEKRIPFTYTKRDQIIEVKSLLDENLCIFDGESVFSAVVNEEHNIPNLTKEIYTGGRTGYYHLPFYIGKLLDIKDVNNNSLMDKVSGYSCGNISMLPEIEPGTEVEVRHLRVPAHYYTGGFTYLNRIKKTISNRVVANLKKI